MRDLARDLRYAARRLGRAPLFTLFAVLSLGVGIGVTTVAYSVVATLLPKPSVTISDPATVAVVVSPQTGRTFVPADEFETLQRSATTFATLAGQATFEIALAGAGRTQPITLAAVTGDYFRGLGLGALRGRTIVPADDRGTSDVVVLSYYTWRDAFASAPDIVGRTVRLGGRNFEVIGVAPRDFTGLVASPVGSIGGWIPLSTVRTRPLDPAFASRATGFSNTAAWQRVGLEVFGRLRTGTPPQQAAAQVAAIAASLDATSPRTTGDGATRRSAPRAWSVQRLTDPIGTADPRMYYVATTLVLLVVVVACTNLANLVLARGTTRQRDFAIRRALGASRSRLVREQLAETVLITVGGAVASYLVILIVARIATRTLTVGSLFTLRIEPGIDQPTLIVAALTLLSALIVVGLEPAVQLTRADDLRGKLADEAGSVGLPKVRRHRMLLRWQVAVATAYFIIAALTTRFVVDEVNHDSGVRLEGLAVAEIQPPTRGWDVRRARNLVERLTSDAAASGGQVAVATTLPFRELMGGGASTIVLSTPDYPFLDQRPYPEATLVGGTPRILDVLGVPLVQGRSFNPSDTADAEKVAVVSRAAARRLFGTVDVVGRQIVFKARGREQDQSVTAATLIGVAGDTEDSYMSRKNAFTVYVPLAQAPRPARIVVERASRDAAAVQGLESAIRRADPDVAVVSIGAAGEVLTGAYPLLRYFSSGSVLLGIVTLTLAMVGLFGIQSHGVTRRTREIGVRMSFGATARQIRRMVLRDGFRPVLDGLFLGLVMGFMGRLIVRAYLSNGPIRLFDPWMFVAVPLPVILATVSACYWPARRASRVDPNVALRHL